MLHELQTPIARISQFQNRSFADCRRVPDVVLFQSVFDRSLHEGQLDEAFKTSDFVARRSQYRSSSRSSSKIRRRAAAFKLESLEERTLLSSTKAVLPTAPVGLGSAYTGLSEEAHQVGVTKPTNKFIPGSTTDTSSGSSSFTMADLESYLKKLNSTLQQTNGQGPTSAKAQAPYPTPNDYYLANLDNPQQESQPVFSVNDPAAQAVRLKLDPQSTGFSNSTAASQVTGFDGMNFLDSVNGYVPPDTSIAVGTQYVVETVNAQIQIYDKTTGQAMLPNTPLYNFFGDPGVSPYQAVATYDDIAGRYIVAANGSNTNLLLAVSIDSNPLDGFNLYNLSVGQFGSYNFNTRIGWNADQVVVTFDTNTYPGYEPESQVISLATSSLFASTPPSNLTLGSRLFHQLPGQ